MTEQEERGEAASAAPDSSGDRERYAGYRLGLPEHGRGAMANWGPRVAALVIDWLLANLVAFALVRDPTIWQAPVTGRDYLPLAVFGVEIWLMTAFVGASIGHRLRHLVVARLDGQPVGPLRGLVRAALILLVIPVLIVDGDGRGLHDRLAGTVLVHAR